MRKDASTVPADPDGKRQHMVEICNFLDAGTSILLDAQVHADFHAQTALEAVVAFLQRYGLPKMLTFDREVRWVGSASGRDFPSALCQMLSCLGVEPNVLPPQRPELNGFVERYHRTYKEECLLVHRPGTLEEVRAVTEVFMEHYNSERPHQGRTCQNQPPRVAHPTLPTLPALPDQVDPTRWLTAIHGQIYARRVKSDGQVLVDHKPYYIKQALAGQQINLRVNALTRSFEVMLAGTLIKTLEVKGLHRGLMPLSAYLEMMSEQARSEERYRLLRLRRARQNAS